MVPAPLGSMVVMVVDESIFYMKEARESIHHATPGWLNIVVIGKKMLNLSWGRACVCGEINLYLRFVIARELTWYA
jgi:hypothetical protein